MLTHEDQVTDPLYWNWVKGGLGLKYLKEGLESFVDDTLKDVQAQFLDDIRRNTTGLQEVECTECTTANVLPCPTPGTCNIRKRGKISMCSYHDKTDKLKTSRPCPNSICDKIPLKIRSLHRYEDPSWKNTNAQNWSSNHFEIGKCFLPKSGYEDKTATSETDSSGILNMAINCLSVQRQLAVYINPPNDILSKLVKARNIIFHSTSCHLTKEQLDSYIDDMVTLLEDKKTLLADLMAQTAVLKLKQLKQGPFHISPKDELDIRNGALRAVEEKKKNAIQEIQDKQEEVIDLIKETQDIKQKDMSDEMTAHTETMANQCDALRSSIQTLKSTQASMEGNIENHEHRLKDIEQSFNKFKTSQAAKWTMLIKDFSEFKEAMKDTTTVEHQHKDRIEYIKRKLELQNKLCEMYKSHIESIPLSPVLDGLDARIDDLFVELVICNDKIHEPRMTDQYRKEKRYDFDKKVESYKDIFVRTENVCKIKEKEERENVCKNKGKHECESTCEKEERESKCKNMYVIGDAGMGKSTWCMKMVSTWISALMNKDTLISAQARFRDEQIMSDIDLLFFVSLRHAVNDGAIIDMVTHQLFDEFPEMDIIVKEVLRKEPHKCLIVLDGLDEWRPPENFISESSLQHPALPSRHHLHGCPVLTTTRPWKLDEVRLSSMDIDRAVKIQGLKNQHELIKRIICHLNDKSAHEDDHKNKRAHDFVLAFEAAFHINTGLLDQYLGSDNISADMDVLMPQMSNEWRIHSAHMLNEEGLTIRNFHDSGNVALDDYNSNISFYRIPLILVFMLCLWYDEEKLETTWAANFTGLIGFLIKIAERKRHERRPGRLSIKDNLQELKARWSKSIRYLPESLHKLKQLTNYSELILNLSKLAFGSLFDDSKESTLVFTEDSLTNDLNPDDLDVALQIGIISQSKVVGKTLKRLTSLSFLHKIVQEYFTALYFVWKHENNDKTAFNKYINYCRTTKDIKEMENVLLFVCGLSARTASEMSRHVAYVTQYDQENLLGLKTKCVSEMQAAYGPSYPSVDCPIFTFNMEMNQFSNIDLAILEELIKTNTNHLVSLKLKADTRTLEFVSAMTQLQELSLYDIGIGTLDLLHLRQLHTIQLYRIERTCKIRLDGSKVQNILMSNCNHVEIKTLSNCQVSNETSVKEDIENTCIIKDISLVDCLNCKISIERVMCSIDKVNFKKCNSCQFTMKVSDVTHEVTKTGRGQRRSHIHCLVFDSSKELTFDIDYEAEIEEIRIITEKDVEDYIEQFPGFKKRYVRHYYSTLGRLPQKLEEITIPDYTEWIAKMVNQPNISCIRIDGYIHKVHAELIGILATLPELKSFQTQGTLTTQVLQTLKQSYIQRLKFKFHAHDQVTEILSFLTHMQSLRYLKLDNIDISYGEQLSHMLLRMSQLNTLKMSISCPSVGIDSNNIDMKQQNQEYLQELLLESFSVNNRLVSKAILNYLKNCRHLKNLKCGTYLLTQLVLIPELKPILGQVETFKSKGCWRKTSLEYINKMSNLRHVDLCHQCFKDFNDINIYFVDMEHLESLKLYWDDRNYNDISLSRQFVDSLPATRQPITIEISNCRLNYDVEQYLRSHQWLQSVERTVTHVNNIKILFWKRTIC